MDGLVYFRLHGSPEIYYSAYPDDYLVALAKVLLPGCEVRRRLVHLRQRRGFRGDGECLDVLDLTRPG